MSYLDEELNTPGLITIDRTPSVHEQSQDIPIQHRQMETVAKQVVSSRHSGSQKASSSRGSSLSSSSLLARKQAKADAARARVQFAHKEINLKKQQANLEAELNRKKAELAADLDLLKAQSEVAAAEAELGALLNGSIGRSQQCPSLPLPVDSPMDRTSKFVMDYTVPDRKYFESTPEARPTEQSTEAKQYAQKPSDTFAALHTDRHQNTNSFNVNAEVFTPRNMTTPALQDRQIKSSVTSEITNFLMKKELLFTRLTNFTDRPEMYASWKASFCGIMHELHVTPSEEMDLLVKWLGPDSCRHAQSLRAANISHPMKGLERIWQRLDERYGSPEVVEQALKTKLDRFPKLSNKDTTKLYELSDILSEIESVKEDLRYAQILSYFDASSGVRPIVEKLPYGIQEKWISHAVEYKRRRGVPYPPFTVFAAFMREISMIRNDPSFTRENSAATTTTQLSKKVSIFSKKIEVTEPPQKDIEKCPLHKVGHSLNQCRAFRFKPIKERKELIKKFGICYKCCASYHHLAKACKESSKCDLCNSETHPTALHPSRNDSNSERSPTASAVSAQGGETQNTERFVTLSSLCTELCGQGFMGKSCAKIVQVNVYSASSPNRSVRAYAILDDQSNASLGKPELFKALECGCDNITYTLSSCAGTVNKTGKRVSNIVIESLDRNTRLTIPNLIECDDIPNVREEIPTPEVVANFPHLQNIHKYIRPLEDDVEILLLIGRDLLEAHHVLDQRIGPSNTPFAQKLPLGWVIIGQACLGRFHSPNKISVSKTHVLSNGRPTMFEPCPNQLYVKENFAENSRCISLNKNSELGSTIFETTPHDEELGMSVEDHKFNKAMEQMHRNVKGNWVAPLPFREKRQHLPNNRSQALKRAFTLRNSLENNAEKKKHFVTFMQKMLDKGHAEMATPLKPNEECWYLPIFGVYHPRKRNEIRIVFDSSAQFEGVSLNSVLLTGPDLTNSLLGILMRFRKEQVAVTVDIEQMFYCFYVKDDQRNFLRFLWHQNNDPGKPIVDYRICVHAFGNSPSPAIATHGLRKTSQLGESKYGKDTREFVARDFYVDDGVTSLPSVEQAVDLLDRTKKSLLTYGNLRLHKLASNKAEVMASFSNNDLAKDLRNLDLNKDSLPTQRSLGLSWNLESDTLTFKVCPDDKPYTRRGMFSTVNSIYDPLGFVAPVTIQGKLLLRDLVSNTKDWDEPLPPEHESNWNKVEGKFKVIRKPSHSTNLLKKLNFGFTTQRNPCVL